MKSPYHRLFCLVYCGEPSNFTRVVRLAELSGLPETWDSILSYTPCSLVVYSPVGDNNTGTQISKSASFSVLNCVLRGVNRMH